MAIRTTNTIWRIQLFQGLKVQKGAQVIERFETRRAAALLAYLAFYPNRNHSREELIEMLWPEEDLEATRLRFRQVLTTLRRLLDSPTGAEESLLLSDRTFIRINAAAVTTDAQEFEALLKSASQAEDTAQRVERLTRAAALYAGELLPGSYETWVLQERRRLQDSYRNALLLLANSLAERQEVAAALGYVRRAVEIDPLDEPTCGEFIRLCIRAGRSAEALRHYRELEQTLWKELRMLPSTELQSLITSVRTAKVAPPPFPSVSAPSPAPAEAAPLASPENPIAKPSVSEGIAASISDASTLPEALTPFFGRQEEIRDLTALLSPRDLGEEPGLEADATFLLKKERMRGDKTDRASTRLVTLIGPGGAGKTRLALEIARRLAPQYGEAVWFAPLAEVTAADRIMEAIAQVIYPEEAPTSDALERIVERLNLRPSLLVLDNFEHLAESGAHLVRLLLERTRSLRCLATSRQALNLTGERRVEVPPLPVPDLLEDPQRLIEGAAGSPSVRLFEDRARNAAPDFEITKENVRSVAALCRHLEGFPLSIELAAAWMSVLDPEQLLQRLGNRFEMLVSQQQDVPTRQRSLRATIEWSCRHLPPDVQRLFDSLSVFHDGWTVEAAEAVCEEAQTLASLAQLQRHALVRREATEGGMRLRMLETLREFAAERLDPVRCSRLSRNHALYYLSFAECTAPKLIGPNQSQGYEQLQNESENLRAALNWCVGSEGEVEIGLRFVAALWRFWEVRGYIREAQVWIETILERGSKADGTLRARALEGAGIFALNQFHHALAQSRLEESVRLYEATGDEKGQGIALTALAATHRDSGNLTQARIFFEQALTIHKERKETFGIASALGGLGATAAREGDLVGAHSLLEQSAAMFRICGHRKGLAWCHYERGLIAFRQGDLKLCLALFQEGLPISRVLNESRSMMFAFYNIGAVHQRLGAQEEAQAVGAEALCIARAAGLTLWEVCWMLWLGDMAYDRQDGSVGRRCYMEALDCSVRAQLTPGMVTMIERFAQLAFAQDQPEWAVRLFGVVERWAGVEPVHPPNAPRYATVDAQETLRRTMDEEGFAYHWRQGQEMTLEQAAEALLNERGEA